MRPQLETLTTREMIQTWAAGASSLLVLGLIMHISAL